MGARVGQFGQHRLWDVKMPSTWRAREPSYLIQPLIRQVPDGAFSTARTPIREVKAPIPGASRRKTKAPETCEEGKTPAPAPVPKVSEEELKRWDALDLRTY